VRDSDFGGDDAGRVENDLSEQFRNALLIVNVRGEEERLSQKFIDGIPGDARDGRIGVHEFSVRGNEQNGFVTVIDERPEARFRGAQIFLR